MVFPLAAFLPAAIGAVGSLIGGAMNNNAQKQAQNSNIKEAQRAEAIGFARDDNKIQRLVADAKIAGIHPLAALGSSASGTMASPVSPSFQANTAAGDAVAQGAASFGSMMPTETSELNNELLRAQIGVARAQAVDLLANATSRTMVSSVRARSMGGAAPTSSDVVTMPSPFGLPGIQVANPEMASEAEKHFGDVMNEAYGVANWIDSIGRTVGRSAAGSRSSMQDGGAFKGRPKNAPRWY